MDAPAVIMFPLALLGILCLAGAMIVLAKVAPTGARIVAAFAGVAVTLGIMLLFFLRPVQIEKARPQYGPGARTESRNDDFVRRSAEMPDAREAPTADADVTELAAEAESTASSSGPAWLNAPPSSTSDIVRMVVSAGPHARVLDCQRELDEKLQAAARNYISEHIGHGRGQRVSISPALREQIVADEYVETRNHSFGNMHQVYLLLEFDKNAHDELWKASRQAVIHRRLVRSGLGLTAGLLLLSTVFGYLRIDRATGGKYRGRLRFAAGTVILALLGTGALIARV